MSFSSFGPDVGSRRSVGGRVQPAEDTSYFDCGRTTGNPSRITTADRVWDIVQCQRRRTEFLHTYIQATSRRRAPRACLLEPDFSRLEELPAATSTVLRRVTCFRPSSTSPALIDPALISSRPTWTNIGTGPAAPHFAF